MMDFMLQAWVSSIIERKKAAWVLGKGERWVPGKKLKLLFAGYNGARNMGSDARVEEMIRQLRHVLGPDNVDFSVMSQSFKLTDGYFKDTRQVHLPDIFPPFLSREVPQHHGVVACEGSMFKSKFANALTTMMIGSLGLAAAENKLSVGYGAEAGHMDTPIRKMCARFCRDSLVITRNEESRTLLRELGVPTELGTDTAWTFPPNPPEYGRRVLGDHGWDGTKPVLVVCPINPFEWPVRASIGKLLALTEHHLDYAPILEHARALREQIDWHAVEARTEHSPFARAFLYMLVELGIRDAPEPVAVGVGAGVGAGNDRWSRAG